VALQRAFPATIFLNRPGNSLPFQIKDCSEKSLLTLIKIILLKGFLAHDILSNIPDDYKIGFENKKHTYWVMPIETHNPDGLIRHLRSNGFDASQKASSLIKLGKLSAAPQPNELALKNLVYLPVYPAMSRTDRHKLTQLLVSFPD